MVWRRLDIRRGRKDFPHQAKTGDMRKHGAHVRRLTPTFCRGLGDGRAGPGLERSGEKGEGRERLAKERPNWPIQTLARIDIVEGRVEIVE